MKHIKLVVLSLAALLTGRRDGFCTANTLSEDVAALNARLADLEAKNAELAAQNAQLANAPAPAPDSTLTMLCKGADVDIADVRWRIQAGLDPEQAVEAAIAQQKFNASAGAKK